MPTEAKAGEVWRLVEKKLGEPVSNGWRQWLGVNLGRLGQIDDGEEIAEVADDLVSDLRAAQKSGLLTRDTREVADDDERWRLLGQLNQRFESHLDDRINDSMRGLERDGVLPRGFPTKPSRRGRRLSGPLPLPPEDETWKPLRIGSFESPLTTPTGGRWISIEVDSRLPFQRLVALLRKEWPVVTGGSRRPRPLGERKLALLRFVCLNTAPDDSWGERTMKWNAANPQWIYQNHRSLYSDFKRGEKSLTGNAFGLEWFYDSTTRMTFEELGTAAMSGDRSANSRIARLLNGEPYAVQWNMQGHIEAQLSAELDSAWRAKFNKQSEKSSSDQGAQR